MLKPTPLSFLARPENREQLDAEIRKADVICIVYAIDNAESFARVPEFWLPYIRKLGRNVCFLSDWKNYGPLS